MQIRSNIYSNSCIKTSQQSVKDCAKEELVVFSKIQVIKVYLTSRGTNFTRKFKFRLLTLWRFATVCNPTITPTPKKQLCILHTIASGVHGRFQEMSNLHYQIGLILAHGGCTVRVHILSLNYFVMFPVPWLKANKVLYLILVDYMHNAVIDVHPCKESATCLIKRVTKPQKFI